MLLTSMYKKHSDRNETARLLRGTVLAKCNQKTI